MILTYLRMCFPPHLSADCLVDSLSYREAEVRAMTEAGHLLISLLIRTDFDVPADHTL